MLGRRYRTVRGEREWLALIVAADPAGARLSFENLVEAHVLRALRVEHGVRMAKVREALRFAEHKFHLRRLLLSKELAASPGRVFLERYGQLVELSASGQLVMRAMFDAHLERIVRDARGVPSRLYPFPTAQFEGTEKAIAIDARVSFGRPIVANRGIRTAIIAERLDAGESIADLAGDYGLSEGEIVAAATYERAA